MLLELWINDVKHSFYEVKTENEVQRMMNLLRKKGIRSAAKWEIYKIEKVKPKGKITDQQEYRWRKLFEGKKDYIQSRTKKREFPSGHKEHPHY